MENKDIDQHIDKTLKNCFDAQKHTVPKALWEQIADGLDQDALLDDKLKETGEEILHTAPAGLWGMIADSLDKEIVTDSTIDKKVKESITNQPVEQAPGIVWTGIEKQLNLDQTWTNIAEALPEEGTPITSSNNKWRKNVNRIATAAMLLLLLRTCVGDGGVSQWSDSLLVHLESTNETELSSKETGDQSTLNTTTNARLPSHKKEKADWDSKNEGQIVVNEIKTVSSSMTPISTEEVDVGIKKLKEPSNTSSNRSNSSGNSFSKTKIGGVGGQIEKSQEKKQPLPTIAKINTSLGQENVDKLDEEENNGVNDLEALFPKDVLLGSIAPLQYRLLSNDIEISSEKFASLDNILEVEPSPLEGKLSVGIFTVFNSTTLLNEETREGFSGSDRVQNAPRFAANYGVWIGYQFLPKSSLIVEFSINADNRQAYRIVEDRISYTKEWVMKYNRISLGYQHDLMQTEGKVSSRIIAQGGIYLGLLRQAKLFYDGELFFDAVADHHQFDFGFKIALGQELTFGKFALGYGVRSDVGATNIFRGNNFFPAQENKTNLLQLGGYITLGYKF